ncbi:hypothetical protein BBJ28_00000868 [Nothophytophthora sp. Chile5]|nr:hypothetical protein BBJ28_00000868 [Nothophytophthora sp. Chile5]
MHFHVSPVHKNLALAYGTMLWLWHPWEHGHGGHDDEAHAEAAATPTYALVNGKITYERSEIGALPTPVEASEEEEEEEAEAAEGLHDEDEE